MGTARKSGPDHASEAGAQPGTPPPPETIAPTDVPAEHHEAHPDDHGADRWRNSSLELEQGLDVSEHPLETLPGDLLAHFKKR
jgi:hypothetical protein